MIDGTRYFDHIVDYDRQYSCRIQRILARYLHSGGFPALHLLGGAEQSAISYLGTLLDGILMRDVVQRHAIRGPTPPSPTPPAA